MKKQIGLTIPKQLALLCKLLQTTPEQVLQAFINDLSQEVHSSGSDERRMAVEYFMRCSYGYHRYGFEEIESMFEGLDRLRWQWPGNDKEKEKGYQRERTAFLKNWYKECKAIKKS